MEPIEATERVVPSDIPDTDIVTEEIAKEVENVADTLVENAASNTQDILEENTLKEGKQDRNFEEALERAYEIQRKRRQEREEREKREEIEKEKERIIKTRAMQAQLAEIEENNRRNAIEQMKKKKLDSAKERHRQEQLIQNEWRERFGSDYKFEESTDKTAAVQGKSGRHLVAFWCNHLLSDNKDCDAAALKKCFTTVRAYVSNVIKQPTNMKYRSIRKENEAFKKNVIPFQGSIELLNAVGFKDDGAEYYTISGSPDLFLLGNAAKYIDFQLEKLNTAQ